MTRNLFVAFVLLVISFRAAGETPSIQPYWVGVGLGNGYSNSSHALDNSAGILVSISSGYNIADDWSVGLRVPLLWQGVGDGLADYLVYPIMIDGSYHVRKGNNDFSLGVMTGIVRETLEDHRPGSLRSYEGFTPGIGVVGSFQYNLSGQFGLGVQVSEVKTLGSNGFLIPQFELEARVHF